MLRRYSSPKAPILALCTLTLVLLVACGSDATATPRPTAVPPPTAAPAVAPPIDTAALRAVVENTIAAAAAGAEPAISEQDLARLVEQAVAAATPSGASAAEIQALVEEAVAAAAAPGVTSEEIEALVSRAVTSAVRDAIPTAAPVPVATAAPPTAMLGPKVTRLIMAVNPAFGETNRPWGGSVDHQQQMDLVHEVLVDIDPETNLWVPELAKSWEMSADGKAWTFELVEGVPWHADWGEFTAKDVLHTVAMYHREDTLLTFARDWREIDLETSEIVSDHQVILRLKNPNPDFLFYIAPSGGGIISSKALWDARGDEGVDRDMVGTGPYRYTGRELGVNVTYQRLPDHWRVNNPQADWPEFELRWISEPATRNAALLTGEVHVTELTRELADAAVRAGMKVIPSRFAGNQVTGIFQGLYPAEPGNFDPPYKDVTLPYTDPLVRQAIAKAIDIREIGDTLYSGRYGISSVLGFYPNLPGWNDRWPEEYDEKYGYDPERSKELLEEAGYSDGLKIRGILVDQSGFPESKDTMQAVQIYLQDVGIEMVLEEWDRGQWVGAFISKDPESYAVWVVPPSYKTVFAQLSSLNRSPVSFYESQFLDEKFEVLQGTVDLDQRDRIQREMGDHLWDNFAYIPMFYYFIEFVVDPNIVEDWPYPGSDGANYGHLDLIKACRTPEPCR